MQRRDFTSASRHLMQASHNRTDAYFGFAVRELMLKIAFESEDPSVDACIDMFRKHLERHQRQIGEQALLFKKFLDYFRLLERARHDRAALEVLLGRLLEEEKFPARKWLLAMARQCLGRHAPRAV
ncbi:MAG: hypothetical protein KatS3mg031_2293 [Chitinophagales bacterium]|nr:MAG: hypothetical protein KatS3mg031_2293 [Chitinophagales bacterium]